MMAELSDLAAVQDLHGTLTAGPDRGITDLVPAARTLLLRWDPLRTDRAKIEQLIATHIGRAGHRPPGREIEIPVVYDGEDLAEVARLLGLSVEALVARHQAARFSVAFNGFVPGFAYMVSDDPGLEVPRRTSPRLRIPAGSIAMAGPFSGIYPSDTPGGWQLLGRTPLQLWEPERDPAALLAPGDLVRFRAIVETLAPPVPVARVTLPATMPLRGITVTRVDWRATFQDLGRAGQARQGVPVSGALDRASLKAANRAMGNAPGEATIEILNGGFALRAESPLTAIVTGADVPLSVINSAGNRQPFVVGQPIALDLGDTLELGVAQAGVMSYLAVRGGFTLAHHLGSAATDTLSRLGPPMIKPGDGIVLARRPALAVSVRSERPTPVTRSGETVTLDLLPGPRADWFTPAALDLLTNQPWQVTGASDRIGLRLSGIESLVRAVTQELPSEGTVRGALQVPGSGQPILFQADHPLTGGYPVIAILAAHDQDRAAQIPPGAWIRFRPSVAPPSK